EPSRSCAGAGTPPGSCWAARSRGCCCGWAAWDRRVSRQRRSRNHRLRLGVDSDQRGWPMDVPTLLKTLDELRPKIRSRRAEIETARRLPPDLVQDLLRAGAFCLEVPRALGGLEAEPLQVLDAIETVASADGSTGWCLAVGSSSSGIAGFTSEAGAREVFTDPTIPAAGAFAPTGSAVRVDGGIRIGGRWQFASGITHAPWLWAGCVMTENGQPQMTPHGPEILHAW